MTQAELDHLLTYHPPTPETQPKYLAIRELEQLCYEVVPASDHTPCREDYTQINSCVKGLCQVILDLCPGSADQSAALRCAQLGRGLLREYVQVYLLTGFRRPEMLRAAEIEFLKARIQACRSIACERI